MNKKRSFIPFSIALVATAIMLSAVACDNDDGMGEMEVRRMIDEALRENNKTLEFTQWKIVNVVVGKGEWKWNNEQKQWEAIADLPELTEFIYENGAALGYLFLGTQGKDEVQKMLPYVNTYSYDNTDSNSNANTFTETISCDFQLGEPSTVAFFIKDSELKKDMEAPQDYVFRIVLIW